MMYKKQIRLENKRKGSGSPSLSFSSAFTLIELVIIIVVIGILSAVLFPRFNPNRLDQAANNILQAIRYTQHLAILDDKFSQGDSNWSKKRWRIAFRECASNGEIVYEIVYDKDGNKSSAGSFYGKDEAAKNPLTGKLFLPTGTCQLYPESDPSILLTTKYGLTKVRFSGGCNNKYVGFDEKGRPYGNLYHSNPYGGLINQDCNITFFAPEGNFTITVTAETGYVYLSSISYY